MQLWGRNTSGTIRFFCSSCRTTDTRRRPDRKQQKKHRIVTQWLTRSRSLSELAYTERVHPQTLRHWSTGMFSQEHIPTGFFTVVVLDVVWISHAICACIARDPTCTPGVIGWVYGDGETRELYERLINNIYGAIYVVDGHPSAVQAIHTLHPLSPLQRCIVHIERQIRIRLTTRPKTLYGRQLLGLVKDLWSIQTKRHKRRWVRRYQTWRRRSYAFLSEKTYSTDQQGTKRWWHTHKNLRRARTHVDNALPHMFRYVTHQDQIPKHTNHVEGGVNSRLKELLYRHRGLSVKRRLLLTSLFLTQISSEKPTRKYH